LNPAPPTIFPSADASPIDLAQVAESALANVHGLEQQLKQCQEDLDVCAAQIGTDYEQLVFLRTLAEYLDMSEVSHGTWQVAKTLLPQLANVIQAESLVLVAAQQEDANPGEAGIGRPVMWVGPVRLDDEECRRFIEKHRGKAAGQPLVVNHFNSTEAGREFPPVRKFLMVSVAKLDRTFGWLVGINRRRQPKSEQADPLWDLSQFEFGSVEAGVFGAAATMLATHAHNVELFREKESLLLGIVRAMVSAIDAKDPYTCGHSERVALVGQFLGKQLGLPEEQCEHIYLAGLLHDLGKLGVPDAILRKPGPLNNDEANELRVHPERGWAILQDLDQLKHLVPGILCHHERYDGKGYPDGLAGEAIPLTARVLAVADSYDAMVSDRPYRKGMPHEKVERILREGSGTQWDPQVIDALFRNLAEIKARWNTHQPHVPRLRQRATAQGDPQ
jgi:HD-GYP domain-containing protein (c-di-GMP phosphodiesterase class II)